MKLFFVILIFLLIPSTVLAQTEIRCPEGIPQGSKCLPNPLGFLGVNSPAELVARVFQGFAGIIGVVAIAFTVFSGFRLVIATNEESISTAKTSLSWSVGGFIIALLSFTIISGVADLIGFEPGQVGVGTDTLRSPLLGPTEPDDFLAVLNFLMINVLGLIGFATILMIIYYGYRYITSAGNEEVIEQAKSGLKWAIIGLVITLLSFTIITVIRQNLLAFQ